MENKEIVECPANVYGLCRLMGLTSATLDGTLQEALDYDSRCAVLNGETCTLGIIEAEIITRQNHTVFPGIPASKKRLVAHSMGRSR